MANVRIGPDGTILKDDQVVSTENRTVIGEDGTIVSTSVARSETPVYRGGYNAPPVSPLEGNRTNTNSETVVSDASGSHAAANNSQAVREQEFAIQRMDGQIRNAFPKQWIIVTAILCILGAVGAYILFVPALGTAYLTYVGFKKKAELEAERNKMVFELEQLRANTNG